MVKLTTEKILRSVPGWKKNQNESPQRFLRKLTHLHLEEKDLTEMDGRLLRRCSSLVVLYLFDNFLSQIPCLCSCCSNDTAYADASSQSLSRSTTELDTVPDTSLSETTNSTGSDVIQGVDSNNSSTDVTTTLMSRGVSDLSMTESGGVGSREVEGRGVCYTPHLSMLYLQNNNLTNLEHLHSLSALTKLYLGGNCISMLEGLEELQHLQELHIENQRLAAGERLYIDHRSIHAIASSLVVLNVSGNNLISLSDLRPLTRLTDLTAASNCVTDLDLLAEDLEVMTCVTRLDLSDNPVCGAAKYRDRVILATSRIEHLDGKPVTEMSRKFLQNWHASRVATANQRARGRSQERRAMNGHAGGESEQQLKSSTNQRQARGGGAAAAGDAPHYLPALPPSRYTYKRISRSVSDWLPAGSAPANDWLPAGSASAGDWLSAGSAPASDCLPAAGSASASLSANGFRAPPPPQQPARSTAAAGFGSGLRATSSATEAAHRDARGGPASLRHTNSYL